jgi:ABC-2 type transport system ATP-binding protein
LQHRGRSRIGDLSKGNAQRIQLLCALAHGPSLLVLDEPFSGLDPVGQAEIQTLFSEHRACGGSILLSTHGMATAEKLCDRVVILSGGRAVFEGEVEAARALAPHGAYVSVDDEEGLLAIAASLGGKATPFPSKIGRTLRWQVQLPQSVPSVSLVRALTLRQVGVLAFEPIEASLEGAFWSLAGPQEAARPAKAAA